MYLTPLYLHLLFLNHAYLFLTHNSFVDNSLLFGKTIKKTERETSFLGNIVTSNNIPSSVKNFPGKTIFHFQCFASKREISPNFPVGKRDVSSYICSFSVENYEFRVSFQRGNSQFRSLGFSWKLHCQFRHNFPFGKLARKFGVSLNFVFGKLL